MTTRANTVSRCESLQNSPENTARTPAFETRSPVIPKAGSFFKLPGLYSRILGGTAVTMSKTRPTDYVAVELYLVLDLTSTVVLFTDLATQTIPNLPGFRKRTTKARDFVMAFKSFNSEIRRLETQFNCREKQLTDLSLRQSEHMQLPIPLFVPLLDALLKDTKTTMRNFENWVDNLQKCYETEDATGQGWLERLENLRRQWNP